MTCCQWATVRLRHLCAHFKQRRRWLAVSRGFVVGLYARWPRDKSRLLTVVRPALIPYRFLIHAVKARALKKRPCRTSLSNARSWGGIVFRGAPEDLSGTKDPVAACLLSMRLTVARVKNSSNSTLLNALTGKCKHLMPNTHKGWTGHYSNNQKNFWKNMQILIQSCHSVKIDLGERPHILWFRSSTIPLDLALNVCPR